jgi:cation transport ATPase
MWLSKAQITTLLFALTAASFGLLALTLLGAARARMRLALYAALALGVAAFLGAPFLFEALTRHRVETGLAVALPLVAAAFLSDLARSGRRTRAFLFAASSVLVLAALAELAARRQVLVAAPSFHRSAPGLFSSRRSFSRASPSRRGASSRAPPRTR